MNRCTQKGLFRGSLGACVMACTWLMSVAGCVEGFDAFNQSDAAYYRLYDYTIDRPRVLGIRYTPRTAQGGDVITFEALYAAPEGEGMNPLQWWGCGTSLTEPFSYYQADCLNTAIAEYLGEGSVLALTLPEYDASSCEYGCIGYIPIFAEYTSAESDASGMAATWISPDYAGAYEDQVLFVDLDHASLKLLMKGDEDGEVEGKPGERISLKVEAETFDVDFIFSWYVTRGTLLSYGVTRATAVELNQAPRKNRVVSENILEVPAGETSSNIDVYVVIDPATYYYPGVERFLKGMVHVSK